jgi:hypothetical protein
MTARKEADQVTAGLVAGLAAAVAAMAVRLPGLVRRRLRAVRAVSPQAGALTLEWIVIAGILVAAATVAAAWFTGVIHGFESKIP